jgi:hypothetical protein
MAREDVRFTRREVREALSWSDTQLKVHLSRLVDLEYLAIHPAPGRGGRYGYELVYRGEGAGGERFVLGLLDVEALGKEESKRTYDPNRSGSDANWSGSKPNRSGGGRPPVGPRSGGGPDEESAATSSKQGTSGASAGKGPKNTFGEETADARTYVQALAARGLRR